MRGWASRAFGAGCGLILAALACRPADSRASRRDDAIGPLVGALRDGAPLPTRWAVQLSVATAFEGCDSTEAGRFEGVICRASPASAPSAPRLAAVGAQAAKTLRQRVEADAVHAAALVDLLSGDPGGTTLDRSISMFEMATRLAPRSASAHVDLSGAYVVRASRRADTRDLLRAADAAARALELDRRNVAAKFNRSLALDLLGVDGEAGKGWRELSAGDSASPWTREARRRLHAHSTRAAPAMPEVTASNAALSRFAAAAPTEARNLVWERLLHDWADATLAGDSVRAAARLGAASAIASTLADRYRDSSVADAIGSIRRGATSTRAARRLAVAHRQFGRAQERARVGDRAAADSGFVAVLESAPPSPVLRRWSTLGHGNALVYQRRPDDAERVMRALVDEWDGRRDAALRARALWTLGVLRLRHGETEAGLGAVTAARDLFAQLGEREYVGAMTSVEGEVMRLSGNATRGYAGLHRALLELRWFPASVWRHNALFLLAQAATADGLTAAATAIEDEDAAVAAAGGLPEAVAEVRLTRARALWARGRRDEAQGALAAAGRAIDTLRSADARAQLRAELDLIVAGGPLRSQPVRAYALADSVVAFFAPLRHSVKLIRAYVARAEAALALGRLAEAEADLDSAAALYDPHRRQIAGIPQRALLLASARSVFDGLVMVRLKAGRVSQALEALERGRVSFSVGAPTAKRPDASVGAGEKTLDYAIIGDTLLAWVLDGRDTTVDRSVVDRARLFDAVERTRAALELGSPEETVRPDLGRLYDWLVRRVEQRLGAAERPIVIVTDEEIGDVPFTALYDDRRGRYLVEQHAIRLVSTLRESRPARRARPPEHALLVASPTLDGRTFPGLAPLPLAEREARGIALLYGRPTVLSGAAADSASVVSALGRAELFHFAGHAVFDDARPEQSFLALRPRGLTSEAIATLDLGGLRLVVLSACETTRSPAQRSGGFIGLAEAFLSAGADGVVGSLWRVRDEHADTLMRAFHRTYRRSADPPGALRAAQLEMLRSSSPALRSPSTWAAFRYVGR